MATTVRIIPVLTVADGKLVKTVQFQNPRNLNSPMATVRLFNKRNVDEMVILFIDSKIDFDLFDQIARECFMPLAVGGGIRTMDEVDRLFSLGADKVVIRTATELIPKIAKKYGAQAVIYALDYIPGEIMYKPPECGEILITDMSKDGKMDGYNTSDFHPASLLLSLKIPIIINGGAGKPEDFLKAYQAGASALAASSIWQYTEHTPQSVKEYLHKNGVNVRL